MNDIDSSSSNQIPIVNTQYYNRRNSYISQGSSSSSSLLHTQPQRASSINYPHSLQNRHLRQSPLYPSAKLYTQPQQIFNSEWLEEGESPINSPTKNSHLIEKEQSSSKMSATATATATTSATTTTTNTNKYDTPLKNNAQAAAGFSYITPLSDKTEHNHHNHHNHNHSVHHHSLQHIGATTQSISLPSPVPIKSIRISNWKIFWLMLNDIVGKDKFAKIAQYGLRLLIHHAGQSQTYLSDDKVNIKTIRLRYNDSAKQLDLLKNFIKHPADFVKIIIILVCSIFKTRLTGMVNGLSMYRQFLRFGKTPFRMRDLMVKLQKNVLVKNNTLQVNKHALFNRKTLGQLTSLYYGINDESMLLYKLNFLTNSTYKRFASRHESYAWYCETWLALYNAYETLNSLTQQEMDLKISIQVKNKARILSKQLLGSGAQILSNGSGHGDNGTSAEDYKLLSDIQFKKNNAWLDVYKNICDLGFNTYTVFQIALPFPTWQIWMGISASFLSCVKLYRETKQKMLLDFEKESN
ncbi:PEX25 [Candida oxycetoniae]|uniref:PEX25 n=1 Tax=Candida oxycetoniae TaxID=497107 RepID=A0AAI9SWY1_9ASCO|nr:PEX25 [Candida oxycetoniae]KAI3404251.2 PEX25 [Candida oxycetoniae]